MNLFNFVPGYESYIYETGREAAFVMILAFIATYIITRGYTRIARYTGWGSASFGGVHTHHMVFGLVIAFVASALMFVMLPNEGPLLLLLAATFGIGASLVLDEFALIFHLQDVYWEEEGRKSVDAVVLGIAFGFLFLLHSTPFGIQSSDSGWIIFLTILLNLPAVLISAFKGKFFISIFGLLIPLVAFIGAVRLAEPDSMWARKFYTKKPKKMTRSLNRYKHYESTWRKRKEWVWDIIGGKTGRPPKK